MVVPVFFHCSFCSYGSACSFSLFHLSRSASSLFPSHVISHQLSFLYLFFFCILSLCLLSLFLNLYLLFFLATIAYDTHFNQKRCFPTSVISLSSPLFFPLLLLKPLRRPLRKFSILQQLQELLRGHAILPLPDQKLARSGGGHILPHLPPLSTSRRKPVVQLLHVVDPQLHHIQLGQSCVLGVTQDKSETQIHVYCTCNP